MTALTKLIFFVCVGQWVLPTFAGYGNLVARAAASPTPISVSPAQNWYVPVGYYLVLEVRLLIRPRDGDDGPWSTFTIRVGTPFQDVRVLISTGNALTWVVEPGGCLASDLQCGNNRGGTFNPNSSSTWTIHGLYELYTERNLGLTGNGQFGNDTLGLGIQGSGGPTLTDQAIGGIVTDNFYLGMFGVNPKPTNFTEIDKGQPSYLTTLKDQNLIPSLSFGYTAGAQYRKWIQRAR